MIDSLSENHQKLSPTDLESRPAAVAHFQKNLMPTSRKLATLRESLTRNAEQMALACNCQLDYSHQSISSVERVLGIMHDEYKSSGSDEGFTGIALSFAAYIVTVIEAEISRGTWQRDHAAAGAETFPFEWNGTTLFPHQWCLNRLFEGPDKNVANTYETLVLNRSDQA